MSAQTGETPIVKESECALRDKTKRLFFCAEYPIPTDLLQWRRSAGPQILP